MRSHETECAVSGCNGVALPRADWCRLHFLKDWHRHNEWLKRQERNEDETSSDTDDEIS